MRALVFKEKLLYHADYPVPKPKENEALVKVKYAGICNTDLEIVKGYMGFKGILGHEFVGIVEDCKEKELKGKRVVGEINIGCGKCYYCQQQMQNHCPDRSVLGILNKDGVFAEYVTLPIKNLHEVPASISDEEAVFIEPLAAALEILEQIEIKPSYRVCVLGDGKLGLLVSQVLYMTCCDLVVIGHHEKKLSILEKRGITTRLSPPKEERFDLVIDCTGSPSGINIAFQVVKPKGRIVIKTTTAERRPLDLNRIVINELMVIGSRCGPFPKAIKMIESHMIELLSLISAYFPLEDGIKAFQYASKKEILKTILRIT